MARREAPKQPRSIRKRSVRGYHWGWHPNGHFVVAHGGKYEIMLARGSGKPLVIKRRAVAALVGPEESTEERASILYQMRQNQPDWSWSGPPIPATKSPMDQLLLPRDGLIWARVPVASERIPDAELAPSRDPNRPVRHFRTPVVHEIFESDGRFLGRVEFPRRTRFIEADGDLVWALVRIEDDLPPVVRFRITPGSSRIRSPRPKDAGFASRRPFVLFFPHPPGASQLGLRRHPWNLIRFIPA